MSYNIKEVKRKLIYLDYAATTPVDPRVLEVMLPYFREKFGNSASLHSFGRQAKKVLEKSRQTLAEILTAQPEEIIFTSSATESNNLALKGIAWANQDKGRHLIISAIEHHCVLNTAHWLEKQGFRISRIPVNREGLVDPREVERAISQETILVSVMHANNEIGTIEPIREIAAICRRHQVYFHTDAAQTFARLPLKVKEMGIDLLTASSHKIYGPKGAALLYLRAGVKIEPLLHGGGHEFGWRPSTVNLPAIVGFAKAAEIYQKEREQENQRLRQLRDKLIERVLTTIPQSYLTGHPQKRLPHHASFRFDGVEGEALVLALDDQGIAVSTASACASQKLEPSHVLLACGLKPEQIHGSLRITLGRWTTREEIDRLVTVITQVVNQLRRFSPNPP